MRHTLLCAETSLSMVLLRALHPVLSHPSVSAQMCPLLGEFWLDLMVPS